MRGVFLFVGWAANGSSPACSLGVGRYRSDERARMFRDAPRRMPGAVVCCEGDYGCDVPCDGGCCGGKKADMALARPSAHMQGEMGVVGGLSALQVRPERRPALDRRSMRVRRLGDSAFVERLERKKRSSSRAGESRGPDRRAESLLVRLSWRMSGS